MEETTLLFRHLPPELTDEERKDLLHYLGATQVKIMGRSGPMKNTAFALFQTKEQATKILNQLHQVEFLSSKLVVEFAKKNLSQLPSVVDNEGVKMIDTEDSKDNIQVQIEPQEVKFDTTFNVWGLKHPRRPELRYMYPPPTQSILTNIMHALAAVPKFYVQVLHLMNKMDLPAPFGRMTMPPPMRSDVPGYNPADDIHQKEMEISSETESELESGDDTNKEIRNKEKLSLKRPLRSARKRATKRPKLSDLHYSPADVLPASAHVQVNEVFEQAAGAGPRKIELKLPSMIQPSVAQPPPSLRAPLTPNLAHAGLSYPAADVSYHLLLRCPSPQHPASAPSATEPHLEATVQLGSLEENLSYDVLLPPRDIQESVVQEPTVNVGGFGVLEPVLKPVEKTLEGENTETEWTKSKFISSKEIKKLKLSQSEMSKLGVFKRYEEGEPSCRLYIKNLAKNITEEDIHWIYGRYVDWDNETEKNIFDIRLMKTGRMKGQGFVTLPSEKVSVTAVRETNGLLLKDKPLVVQFARSAKAQEDESSKP